MNYKQPKTGDIVRPLKDVPFYVPRGTCRVERYEGGWLFLRELESGDLYSRIPGYWFRIDEFLTAADKEIERDEPIQGLA